MATQQGGQSGSGLPAGGSADIYGPITSSGGHWLHGNVVATQPFDVYLQISHDNGTTWTIAKRFQAASGSDPTYVQALEISQYVPYQWKLTLKNNGASNTDYRYDLRLFHITGH